MQYKNGKVNPPMTTEKKRAYMEKIDQERMKEQEFAELLREAREENAKGMSGNMEPINKKLRDFESRMSKK